MSNLDKELKDLFGEHNPLEIDELRLDDIWENKGCLNESDQETLSKYKNLIHLSLNNLGLKSLKNFPAIKGLYVLSLNNNDLSGDDFNTIPKLFPSLYKLKVSGNNIENIDNFKELKVLKLRKIEVKENPFSIGNNKYSSELFRLIPSLEAIDHKTNLGEEIESTNYYASESGEEEDDEYEEGENEDEESEDNDESDGSDYEKGNKEGNEKKDEETKKQKKAKK